ncbi:MAG: amino acid adenylation domain-containing protein [Cyanobacteria bacterium J06626_26]
MLSQVKQAVHDAYEWQDEFSWEKGLVEDDPLSIGSLGFEFESWPDSYSGTDLSFSLHKRFVWRENFKLLLFCLQEGNRLAAEFYHDARLYGFKEIKELSTWFLTLLENAVNQPETSIGQLRLLGNGQQDKILRTFNQTQADYSIEQCVHRLFEEQVQTTPAHAAVVCEGQQLTYGELNAKANQLARYLKALGVDNESLVGIYLERSVDVIVSLLATLKAGGAYVPLDPALPRENLVFRLQDTQMSVLLCQQHLIETLSEIETPLVCLDKQQEAIAHESQADLSSDISVENLAYVLFTSGSTGKPKGVAVEHQQLLNYTRAIAEKLNLSTCKSFATVSTFAADLGNTAIFPALLSGGCLHIISTERASNPETLADYFEHHTIDCLKIVPSHLAALLTSSRPAQILPKQCLILGGEACDWQLVEQIYGYDVGCQMFNHYGPTETTVGVLTYAITPERLNQRPPHQTTVPIGRPIANTQIYLLDPEGQPVPRGVPGEIHIGGAGVSRGYLNRTQLTEERFIINPFIDSQSATNGLPKLYRTGDLGRYQSDGTLEFLGRIDYQVKIRGYRIELGEIESVIRQHPLVKDTVVLAQKGQSGNRRLVAYVVPEKQADLTISELREALKVNLADYMVPAAFVILKSLPLTPNGKVDRQALPAPETQTERQAAFVTPETASEKALAEIWAQTLGIEKIGIHDNFFELGGDSILSIQIVARANQAGLTLTPKQVFENQTIAELATVATTQQIIQAEQGLVIGEVPLTPIQHWFFEQYLPDPHHWNQSILLEVHQPLDGEKLKQAVQQLLEHHDALRLRFVCKDGVWQQKIVEPDEDVPLTWVDLTSVSETDQTGAILEAASELQTSLDLSSGPLLRVAYFDLGSDRSSRLLLIIHHLAVDGVSWRILLEDLQIAHQQISQGTSIQFPPKTTSFKYWAEQLVNYAQSDRQQQELDHWCNQSNQQVEPLPVDVLDNENSVAKARTVSVALDEMETVVLLQEVPAAYRTQINDVLLTALVQAFAQWTGKRFLLVDLEGHGREDLFEHVDVSRTVGWFTTIFPVLLDLQAVSEASPGEALKAIKEQLRSIPGRGIGYGILRYLSNRTDWQPGPSEVRFNYLGQTDQALSSSMFAPAKEPVGPKRSPRGERTYRLDINSVIAGGRLQVDWTYSEAIHHRATVEALAEGYIRALRSLITHCQDPEAGGYTPSDFSEANLNQAELDQFLSKIQGKS